MSNHIPVICDRCRATGQSGEADFPHLGDLLDFAPVPRKTARVDGWSADKQRAFIAAVAATGSKRRAAMSLGMAPYGIDQLLKAEGNDGFKAAYDRALAIAKANGSMKIAQGVADAAARNAQLTPPSRLRGLDPAEPEEDEEEYSDEAKMEMIEALADKFLRKVAVEREARLAGRIVEADFTLRQVTFIEVMLDLGAARLGMDAEEALHQLRRGGHGLTQIVSTPLADWLDRLRRDYWEAQGDPPRPEHPAPRFSVEHNQGPWGSRGAEAYTTQVEQHSLGALSHPARGYTADRWAAMSHDEQRMARQEQFRQDADEQQSWEEAARRDYEERRDSGASS